MTTKKKSKKKTISSWIKQEEREPTSKDLPFVTYQRVVHFHNQDLVYEEYELWDCSDWFLELEDADRAEWKYWIPLKEVSVPK